MMYTISEHTNDFLSSISGWKIGQDLDKLICNSLNEILEINLFGVPFVSPSFVNGAFLQLINLYGEDYFKKNIKIRNANAEVAQYLKQSVQTFINSKRKFAEEFPIKDNVYCAIDCTEASYKLRYHLYEITKSIGIIFRSNDSHCIITDESKNKILQSDCFIGFLTKDGLGANSFFDELNFAITNKKLCLILVEKPCKIQYSAEIQESVFISYYENNNIEMSIRDLNSYISQLSVRNQNNFNKVLNQNELNKPQPSNEQRTSESTLIQYGLLGLLGIAGGFLLKELFKEDKGK